MKSIICGSGSIDVVQLYSILTGVSPASRRRNPINLCASSNLGDTILSEFSMERRMEKTMRLVARAESSLTDNPVREGYFAPLFADVRAAYKTGNPKEFGGALQSLSNAIYQDSFDILSQ